MNWLNRLLHKPSTEYFGSKINASLGFWPSKLTLYKQAFSHSSIDQPKYGNNERLEFLGDSILGNVITEYLYHNLPTKNEGVLTDIRSKMVSRRTLNKLAKKFNIEEIISFQGIKKGIENTNYLLKSKNKKFILTIFEKRVSNKEIPFFMKLMDELNQSNIS